MATIQAEVHMISGCRDSQTSADVSNVSSFQLPDPAGRSGGACTSALLRVLYADEQAPETVLNFQEVLLHMRQILQNDGYDQIPQLTSSRNLDIREPFNFVPDYANGRRHALLIGINYVGHNPGELSGCHNDVMNIKKYIMNVHGFQEEDIMVLMDDGNHTEPTKDNILAAYSKLVAESVSGDAVFCHYSGHGGRLSDDNGDEEDGYDETLVPLDYENAGQIRDDDLFRILVQPMPEGVALTCVMDCCHSGTVLDLPYKFVADGESDEMVYDEGVNFSKFDDVAPFLIAAAGVTMLEECCTVQ